MGAKFLALGSVCAGPSAQVQFRRASGQKPGPKLSVFILRDFGRYGFRSKCRYRIHPIKSTSSHTAGGTSLPFMYAPRTRAAPLSPRPIRGLFWLLDGGTPMHRGALCLGVISRGHRQECPCPSRLVHEGFFHCFRVPIDDRQVGAHGAFLAPAPWSHS